MIRRELRKIDIKIDDLDDLEAVRVMHNRPRNNRKPQPSTPSVAAFCSTNIAGAIAFQDDLRVLINPLTINAIIDGEQPSTSRARAASTSRTPNSPGGSRLRQLALAAIRGETPEPPESDSNAVASGSGTNTGTSTGNDAASDGNGAAAAAAAIAISDDVASGSNDTEPLCNLASGIRIESDCVSAAANVGGETDADADAGSNSGSGNDGSGSASLSDCESQATVITNTAGASGTSTWSSSLPSCETTEDWLLHTHLQIDAVDELSQDAMEEDNVPSIPFDALEEDDTTQGAVGGPSPLPED